MALAFLCGGAYSHTRLTLYPGTEPWSAGALFSEGVRISRVRLVDVGRIRLL